MPVVLRELGVLHYAPTLAAAVDSCRQLAAGGQEEIEIRAATVEAVEQLKVALQARLAEDGSGQEAREGQEGQDGQEARQKQGQGQGLNSVLLDWALWEEGEAKRKSHRPHHRVLTVYY